MAIDVRCPGCRTAFEAPDRLAGKLIRCKSCREEFRVRDDRPADDDFEEPRRPRKARRQSGGLPLVLAIAGGAVILIVLALGAGMFALAKFGIRNADPVPGPPDPVINAEPPAQAVPLPAMTSQAVTLSNLRRQGAGYAVDYAYVGQPKPGESYTLKVRTATGTGDVRVPFMWRQAQSTIQVKPFGVRRAVPNGRVEVWLAKSTGERVSNVVTLD
jgi:hypothetical protein